jgi:hypothetical protein
MSRPQLYVPDHREQFDVVDWFFIVGASLLALFLAYRGYTSNSTIHGVAACGWLLAVSNYCTARRRFNPRLNQ